MNRSVVLLTTTKQFESFRSDELQKVILASIFAGLTGLGAFITIPLSFSPIPITFQTFFVLLSGFILGRHYGPLSQVLYVLLGIIGIPWFSNHKFGLAVVLGSTGGYLLGFIVSAYIVGWITDMSIQSRKPLALFTSSVIGSMIIYVFGILGLLRFFDLWTSLEYGFFPFIPGDLFKIFLLFLVLLLLVPNDNLTFDSGNTPSKNKIWNLLLFIVSLGTFLVFFVYLYSNGNNIPMYLPQISIFTAFCLLPSIWFFVKNNRINFS